jgi:hypothetical protein
MADKVYNAPTGIPQKFKDLGDGTFAQMVSVDGVIINAGDIDLGSVEISNDEGNAVPTEPLGLPGVARQVSVTTNSTNTQLTAGVKRISIKARTCNMRYSVGSTSQTANASTSHFIEVGERLDIRVPDGGHIAVIRDVNATQDGILCITELI